MNQCKKPIISLYLVVFYSLLFYGLFTYQIDTDFTSFYSSGLALKLGHNPYNSSLATYLPEAKKVALNLNPPIFLMLTQYLVAIPYLNALVIWSLVSFVAGLFGAWIAFFYAFPRVFFRQNWFYLLTYYLVSCGIILNAAFAQVGGLLAAFIMLGYHFYLKKNEWAAGFCWGLIISLKLFPGLLLIYALTQKRYRLFFIMLSVSVILSALPLMSYGCLIYKQYMLMMSQVWWYGWNCNSSLFGYIVRILAESGKRGVPSAWMYGLYFAFSATVVVYIILKLRKLRDSKVSHQGFSIVLISMVLLSPLGWVYYFPLLTLPVSVMMLAPTSISKHIVISRLLCFVALLCLNAPILFTSQVVEGSLWAKLTVYSVHFYGLVILLYALVNIKLPNQPTLDKLSWLTCRYIYLFVMFVLTIFMLKSTMLADLFGLSRHFFLGASSAHAIEAHAKLL